MVDEYYEGTVDRISPEFPMSIMTSLKEEPVRKPGGAANVSYQMKHFNVSPMLVGYNDKNSSQVLAQHYMKSTSCHLNKGHVPAKKRFLSQGIQVFRHDIEEPYYGIGLDAVSKLQQELVEKTHKLDIPNAVILSDYNKGFFIDPQCWLQNFPGSITVVDPKKGPAGKWKGCSVFKPNAKEAKEMTGCDNWKDQCLFLSKELPGSSIVITQGGDGVVGWDGDFFEYRPNKKILVESVIGAGDCFVSVLAIALAHGFFINEAAEIAYRAGEVYVQNRLNRPIVPAELSNNKTIHPEDVLHRDFKLVFTNGCFDILHPGHLSTLEFAKSKGDKLLVALNSDNSIRKLKGETRPINNLYNRIKMIASLQAVDFVCYFEDDTPLQTILSCQPDVLVKGGDYDLSNIVGSKEVPEIFIAPTLSGYSTTAIVNQCQ
jgi:D-beta-D-heptose 7-phosphate kinase/D-beta-D-heptose 1-phosphate adenosyltransferase